MFRLPATRCQIITASSGQISVSLWAPFSSSWRTTSRARTWPSRLPRSTWRTWSYWILLSRPTRTLLQRPNSSTTRTKSSRGTQHAKTTSRPLPRTSLLLTSAVRFFRNLRSSWWGASTFYPKRWQLMRIKSILKPSSSSLSSTMSIVSPSKGGYKLSKTKKLNSRISRTLLSFEVLVLRAKNKSLKLARGESFNLAKLLERGKMKSTSTK